tara:strand:+ start:11829 stop:12128 length:300 start_codon:yes stop_codon:yes gene_type:complete
MLRSSYTKEIIISFNKNQLIEKRYGKNLRSSKFLLIDYNKNKYYTCSTYSSKKTGIVFPLNKGVKETTEQSKSDKTILGLQCKKHVTMIKGKPYDVCTT